MVATSKIMRAVVPACMRSPLTSSHIDRACGSGTSSFVTSQGPVGQKFGKLLPFTHCPPRSICQARSETSLTIV
ncbi:hypothetical protein D3C87_2101740 [compost metagenome]